MMRKKLQWMPVLLSLLLWGCGEEHVEPAKQLNEKLYNEMTYRYLWNESIPQTDPLSFETPHQLLEAIRYKPVDTWSTLVKIKDFQAMQSSRVVGHGFGSKFDQQGNLRVSYVHASTRMHTAKVLRGWIIEAINGTTVTPSADVELLLGEKLASVTNTFRFRTPEGVIVERSFAKEDIRLKEVLMDTVLEEGNQKVGYLAVRQLSETAADELTPVFQYFKDQQVSELIVDMRYSSNCLFETTAKLGELIGGRTVAGKPFVQLTHNPNLSSYDGAVNFPKASAMLELSRVIIITGIESSGGELLALGLQPYLDVVVVGEKTPGSPYGRYTYFLDDEWALQLVSFKFANANGVTDFIEGISPDIVASDDLEYDFGDPREEALGKALLIVND